jgi:hypothetical protein
MLVRSIVTIGKKPKEKREVHPLYLGNFELECGSDITTWFA